MEKKEQAQAHSRDREEEVGTPKSLPGAKASQGAEGAKRITGNDLRRTCFGEGLDRGFERRGRSRTPAHLRLARLPSHWDGRSVISGRGTSLCSAGAVRLWRRGPIYLRGLDPGQSGAAVAERRSEPTGPDPRERPGCEEVSSLTGRGGQGRSFRQASYPREAESRPLVRSRRFPTPTAWPGLAWPGPRPPGPGVRSCAAFASRLTEFPRRASRSFPFRSPCRPLPLPAFSSPASRTPLRLPPAAQLASPPASSAPPLHFSLFEFVVGRAGRARGVTAPRSGVPGF